MAPEELFPTNSPFQPVTPLPNAAKPTYSEPSEALRLGRVVTTQQTKLAEIAQMLEEALSAIRDRKPLETEGYVERALELARDY